MILVGLSKNSRQNQRRLFCLKEMGGKYEEAIE